MLEVREWVHATSDENFRSIARDRYLKGNQCQDDFFDGPLCDDDAPMGTWFNANYYKAGPISLTTYPETVDTPFVKALAYPVAAFFDPEKNYELFQVSNIQRTYLQVKYFLLEDTDPYIEWARGRLEPVGRTRHGDGYCDEYVELRWDGEGWHWRAVDSENKVLVGLFLRNDDDHEPRLLFENCRAYNIKKINSANCKSPLVSWFDPDSEQRI